MWFIPGSAMTAEQRKSMPTEVATRMPDALHKLVEYLSGDARFEIKNIDNIVLNKEQLNFAKKLGELFAEYGSDKSTRHNYNILYGCVFALFSSPPRILEIGLGSNNPSIASNMGVKGKPGASLRAFKAFSPNSIVDGADIDETIKVEECRTFKIDQTQPDSFNAISKHGEVAYDIIIDDGLHSPDANLYTLEFALKALSAEGVAIIEDIHPSANAIWKVTSYLCNRHGYASHLISTRRANAFVVSKNNSFMKFAKHSNYSSEPT